MLRFDTSVLIMQNDDVSVYEKEVYGVHPYDRQVGGTIEVVNNHTNEMRWKEWRWYVTEDGQTFNNRQDVIEILVSTVRRENEEC